MDDSALTHQLKQGNQLAFTILYDTYSEQVYRLAFKYLCNKELAEDAVQNLFMKVWIKRTSLDESRPLNHFLFTVLKNDLLTILRDPKNHIFVLDDCLELLERIDGATKTMRIWIKSNWIWCAMLSNSCLLKGGKFFL